MTWEEACARVAYTPRNRDSIGKLQEKTVHAVCKYYLEENEAYHEVKVEGLVADICRADGSIVEVQTRNFDKLRAKLRRFLPEHAVEVIYPMPFEKWVIWMDEDGALSEPRKSPKKGKPVEACYELWRIKEFLDDPNLTVRLLLFDVEEYRLLNGWSKDKKHGSTRYDRVPRKLREEIVLHGFSDYREAFVPVFTFPEEFTAKEFQKANHMTQKRASYALGFLREIGVVTQVGMRGKAYVYRRSEDGASVCHDGKVCDR
ncbi:MAG: hypothetical protein IJ744_05715 [Lachnospiraceae bacterium]|nr:hypothetical protein [Lachnospiraceae bacterium]